MKNKGVSLVAVLLFMLVATIAGTATYKWLNSEARSSSSRLYISEARQAALAGLEEAASWMTFNANDVGAAVKQFFDGGKKPLKLDLALKNLSNSVQNYSVWMVGVNKDATVNKIKLVSEGRSRSGKSVYSETAIFNVSGLYQVKVPFKKVTKKIAFEHDFFGSLKSAGEIDVNSAIVNGNVEPRNAGGAAATKVTVGKYLVVTGNAEFNSDTDIAGDFYIAGQFSSCTNVRIGGNFITPGTFYAPVGGKGVSIGGDMNVGAIDLTDRGPNDMGGCSGSAGGNIDVAGNVTSAGNIYQKYNNDAFYFHVKGNLVQLDGTFKLGVGPKNASGHHYVITPSDNTNWGKVQYSTMDVDVQGNVYLKNGIEGNHVDYTKSNNVRFGNDKAHVYIPNAYKVNKSLDKLPADTYCSMDESRCNTLKNYELKAENFLNQTAFFTIQRGKSDKPSDETIKSWMANDGSTYKEMMVKKSGENGKNCATDWYVPDPLKLNESVLSSPLKISRTNKGGCKDDIWSNNPADLAKSLNECFIKKSRENKLYDQKWLLVEIDAPTGIDTWPTSQTKLDGMFYIILKGGENAPKFYLPEVTEKTSVMLYLPGGWNNLLGFRNNDGLNRYFIFSEKDIMDFQMSSKKPMQGSIFMSNCAQMNTYTHNSTMSARFDESLMSALEESGLVCANDGDGASCPAPSSGTPSGGGSSGGGTSGTDENEIYGEGNDRYFIATSPQLNVSLESQYKSEKTEFNLSEQTSLNSSFIVLPRIVRITQDAYGKLSDYYSVVRLNGFSEASSNTVSCPSEIPVGSSKLFDGSNLIPEGVYTCEYGESYKVPFYVVVSDKNGESPEISFDEEYKEISPSGKKTVYLKAPKMKRQISVDVMLPKMEDLPDGWEILPKSGVTKRPGASGNLDVYTITTIPDGSDLAVFDVTTTSTAPQYQVTFQMVEPCDGCRIGKPFFETVKMTGFANVERTEINATYCAENGEAFKSQFKVECNDVANRRDCGSLHSGTWVTADGDRCYYDDAPNSKWFCSTGKKLSLNSLISKDNDECEAIIPDSSINNPEVGKTYKLPGSLKRKIYTLYVKLKGNKTGRVIVEEISGGNNITLQTVSSDASITVSAGSIIRLTADENGDNFNKFKCDGRNCLDGNVGTTYQIAVSGNNTIEAQFNEKDRHCVYDDFSQTSSICKSNSSDKCIDKCESGVNCSITDGKYRNSDWILVHANKENILGKVEDFAELDIKTKNESSVGAPDYFGSSFRGATSVVLSRAQAGHNGTLTALFDIPMVASNVINSVEELIWKKPTNNGFIFRSNKNATSYFMFSVITISGVKSMARVCYMDGPEGDIKNCVTKDFKESSFGTSVTPLNKLANASISIDVKDEIVKANLSYSVANQNFGSASVEFDLSETFGNKILMDRDDDPTKNKGPHEYMGFKFDNPALFEKIGKFKIFDIAWKSDDYEDDCWATPFVGCSFQANYVGASFPKNTEVSPWVYKSAWFAGKECVTEYYYNGCDLENGLFDDGMSFFNFNFNDNNDHRYACPDINSDGFYRWSARELRSHGRGKLKSDRFAFSREGLHGYEKNGGYVGEASVLVRCAGGDANDHIYTSSCGLFNVGNLEHCKESYNNFLKQELSCEAEGMCSNSIEFATPVNMRDAAVYYKIDQLNAGIVAVSLEDVNGIRSKSGVSGTETDVSGTKYFNVSDVSDESGFDPQRIKRVLFTGVGTTGYVVSSVQVSCPFALSLICNAPVYDAGNGEWRVSALVTHPEQADKCRAIGLDDAKGNNSEAIGCSNFSQVIQQKNVYGQSKEKSYRFRVEALDKDGKTIGSCVTPVKTIPKVDIACGVSQKSVEQGKGVPSFNFTLNGCGSEGCEYTVIYPDGTTSMVRRGSHESEHCPEKGCQSMNGNLNRFDPGSYSYDIDVYGSRCPARASFDVTASTVVVQCSNAKIENGKFIATLDKDSWTGGSFVITSGVLGHNPTNAVPAEGGRSYEVTLPENLTPGTYTATLTPPGGQPCSASWEIKGESGSATQDIKLSCNFSPVKNQDASSAIVISPTVSNCDNSCSWSVSPSTAGGNGSSYDGNSISFYDNNATGSYVLKLNREGFKSASCNFEVEFIGKNEQCGCTCGDCSDIKVNGAFEGTNTSVKCFFGTSVDVVNRNHDKYDIKVNGKVARYCEGASSCNNMLAKDGIAPIDGGYYMEIPMTSEWVKGGVSGASKNPCTGAVEVVDPPGTSIVKSGAEKKVPCGNEINYISSCGEYYQTVVSCSGGFKKTVGNITADQYNSVNYYTGCKGACNSTLTTSCEVGKVMSCLINCW